MGQASNMARLGAFSFVVLLLVHQALGFGPVRHNTQPFLCSRNHFHVSRTRLAASFPESLYAGDVAVRTATDGALSSSFESMAPVIAGGVALLSLAAFKTAVYWRMEYIIAALLSRRVPQVEGGADVLQISAKDTKGLYYLPATGVRRVILSSIGMNEGLATTAGEQLGLTVSVRPQEGGRVDCPNGIVDCVVSLKGFRASDDAKRLVKEAARVLKPGGALLLVERGDASLLVEEVRRRFGEVEVNVVTNLVDPYMVAIATKTPEAVAAEAAEAGEPRNRSERRLSSSSKGSKKKKAGAAPPGQG